MDSFDNRWKNRFDETSQQLPDDWLPADEIMERVEESVFPKKKRRALWFWLFAGLLPLGFLAAVWSIQQKPSFEQIMSDSQQEAFDKTVKEADKTEADKLKNETDTDASMSVANMPTTSNSSSSIKRDNTTRSTKVNASLIERSPSKLNSGRVGEIQNSQPSQSTANALSGQHGFQQQNNQSDLVEKLATTNLSKSDQFSKSQNSSETITEQMVSMSSPLDRVMVSNRNSSLINYLSAQELKLLLRKTPTLAFDPLAVTLDKSDYARWEFAGGLSYGVWDNQLNNAFSSALDPADFYQKDHVVGGVAFSLYKSIAKKWSVGLGISIDRVHGVSGHNSEATYSVDNETTPAKNILPMTLGTPYGLLKTDVTLQRTAELAADEGVDMAIESTHDFTMLSADVMLRRRLFSVGSFGLDLSAGPVYSRIFSIENDVAININNTDKVTVDAYELTAEQDINKSIWSARALLSPAYRIDEKWQVRGVFQYTLGLSDLYKNDAFAVRPNAYRAGLSLSFSF